jgi:hypothetical protein
MKPENVRKGIASVGILTGLFVLVYLVGSLFQEDYPLGWFSLSIALFMAIILVPAAILVWFGFRLFRVTKESTLRWVVGLTLTFWFIALLVVLSELFRDRSELGRLRQLMDSSATILGVWCYLVAMSQILPMLDLPARRPWQVLTQGTLLLLSCGLFFFLSNLMALAFGIFGYPESLWFHGSDFIFPLLVAVIFYKVMGRKFDGNMDRKSFKLSH